jgi:cyclopropane fatty-acyl-phospholipid synthase-like methyltransferase
MDDVTKMKTSDKLSAILRFPAAYRLFQWVVGGAGDLRARYVAEYIKPQRGDKVLDIGCGPGDMLPLLPGVDYVGLDISSEYIEAAKRRFGDRGRFYCTDVGLAEIEHERGQFDLVLATGVLHHLEDERAAQLFELARVALRPGGKLITYDGCYVPEQSKLARWVLSKDRGRFVRSREEYVKLASAYFTRVDHHVRHDLLRIPYTHLIMFCST